MSDVLTPSVAEPAVTVDRPVLLREAREAAGLHIAALAAALKVPVKKLEALEAGRYGDLPDMTFARALASSACRQLKIDPLPVLAQIPVAHSPQLGDSPQAINAPFKGVGGPAPMNVTGWLSRPAVLVAGALLLGALVLVFLPARQSAPQADAVMPPPVGAADAPAQTTEPAPAGTVTESTAPAEPVAGAVPSAVPPVAVPASASAVPVPAVAAGTASAVATTAAGALLTIQATGDSWVEVVNGSGAVVMKRMLKTGDVIDFSTAPPYSVVLGRADAAQVTVRGKPFDTAPFARNSVARFEVK